MKCMECNEQFTPMTKQEIYCHECSKYLWCYLCQYRIEDGEYEECTTCYAKSCQDCYQMAHCDHCGELKCDDCMEKKPSACCLGCSSDDSSSDTNSNDSDNDE